MGKVFLQQEQDTTLRHLRRGNQHNMGITFSCCTSPEIEVGRHSVRILRRIGEGAYSQVFEVMDASTRQHYALKIMLCQSPALLERARLEIEVLSSCSHPNIIPLLDYSQSTSTTPSASPQIMFLFPLYKRGTVRAVLDEMDANKERWSERHVLKLFLSLCHGLSVLHSKNPPLAHRDLKCLNILLSHDGEEVVLMDLGSVCKARVAIKSREDVVKLQEEAEKLCSPMFRPPELYEPTLDGEIDERTDIWSLGCTLYEMAYGKNPFEKAYTHHGASLKLAAMSGRVEFPRESGYGEVNALVLWMMRKKIEERPFIDEIVFRVGQALARAEGQ